jgi:hypothetical protein
LDALDDVVLPEAVGKQGEQTMYDPVSIRGKREMTDEERELAELEASMAM